MSELPMKSVKRFFDQLFSGKISEAERSLENIKKKLGEDEYYMALYGMYYSYVNDDRDSYIFKIWEKYLDGADKKSLRSEIEDFTSKMYSPPSRFLQAWLDLISMMDELPTPHKIQAKDRHEESTEGEEGDVEDGEVESASE